jgi:hypothetical protein
MCDRSSLRDEPCPQKFELAASSRANLMFMSAGPSRGRWPGQLAKNPPGVWPGGMSVFG